MNSAIKVKHNPSQSELDELGVKEWPTWSCEISSFPWSYDANETCYILEGQVTVTPNGDEPVTVGAGDLVTFPAGMACVWDVKAAIRKHYNFH